MRSSLTKEELAEYLSAQLNTFFPDKKPVHTRELLKCMDLVLERVEFCFSRIANKYYSEGLGSVFNHLHGDHYAAFLYFAANTLYRKGGDPDHCAKISHLNRYLHGIDVFHETALPDIFLFVHPLGTVLGRGTYSNYFTVYQRCGIGSNRDVYPVLGEFVTLRPGSSVLGKCRIGENSTIAAGSTVLDRDLDKNSLYIGNPRDFIVKQITQKPSFWKI